MILKCVHAFNETVVQEQGNSWDPSRHLALAVGDVILLDGVPHDKKNWWHGRVEGKGDKSGDFPKTFVAPVADDV